LEVGRVKTGPFHSERRPSQSSQVRSCGIHQGDAVHRPKGVQRWPFLSVCPRSCMQAWQHGIAARVQSLRDGNGQASKVKLLSSL